MAIERLENKKLKLTEERAKLHNEIKELQDKLEIINGSIKAIERAVELLKEDDEAEKQERLPVISTKYENISLKPALIDLINTSESHLWTVRDIAEELLRNGLKTRSNKFETVVMTALSRLYKGGKIDKVTLPDGMRYKKKVTELDRFSTLDISDHNHNH